ncbi:hypothetical protein [Bradyrhizobium cenepequi]|uniref:hypothetical protein n=1 Tax=Bradyrhizobium cenepequi TaxID=2821403 RepID=UPI001CE2CCD8|nr:hypothetical protein [Bradyrhizobium cenepequi]MCA6107134.1 hypothetical protein [Bradyrhizobium cenepequi]
MPTVRTQLLAATVSILVLLTATIAVAGSPDGPTIRPAGSEEVVFQWSTQRCSDNFIPDSPARAFRRRDNSIALIAAHYNNQFLVGSSFTNLRPDCLVSSFGSESKDAATLDTRYWIQAFVPSNETVIALASHEFSGYRHHQCQVKSAKTDSCWFSSILALVPEDESLHFDFPRDPKAKSVAIPPRGYDANRGKRYGFFTTSNAIVKDGFAYVFIWTALDSKPHNCLFRAPLNNVLGNWLSYRNGSFSQPFIGEDNETSETPECDAISPGNVPGQIRSVISIGNNWVAVFMRRTTSPDTTGVYYSTSTDLIHWSSPRHLLKVQPWSGGTGCGIFYEYPSLIDHDSTSRFFDSANGKLYLYLTRANWTDCSGGLNRDLVRVPLQILEENR